MKGKAAKQDQTITLNSRRRNSITVRTVLRNGIKKLIVDFEVSHGGKRTRFRKDSPTTTISGTFEWAERERRAIVAAGRKPRQHAPRADPSSPRSFSYWGKRYHQDAVMAGANRPSTLVNKESALRVHLLPRFGHRPITSFLPEDIRDYITERRDEGAAHGTIMKEVGHFRAVLRQAKEYGLPVERESVIVPAFRQRQQAETRVRIPVALSEEQTTRLLASATSTLDRAIFTCLFRQGMRVGEVQALRWAEDVDLRARRIHVQRSWDRKALDWAPTPKGGKPRTNPMDPETFAVLEALGEGKRGDLLFPALRDPSSGSPMSYHAIRDRLKVLGRQTLDDPLSTHTGRHSFGRHWAERGWPLRGLQEFLGHHSPAVTQIYAHWSLDATADLLASRTQDAQDMRDKNESLHALLSSHGVQITGGLHEAISSLLVELNELREQLRVRVET